MVLIRFAIFLALLTVGCASDTSIFPSLPLSTDVSSLELPNPISIVADETNGQIIVVNSNVDFFFDQGSLATFSVDATDTNAPSFTATSVTATPNFAGGAAFDGATLYIPFREESGEEADDFIQSYTVASASLTLANQSTAGSNPFGIALSGGSLFVASDEELHILNTSLVETAVVDLSTADSADTIEDSDSTKVESVAVDATTNRAFVSNRSGKIFIVDLASNTLTHVIDGPLNTRGIATDGTFIYLLDGDPPALWVFDPSLVAAPSTTPEEVDEADLVVDVLSLGNEPNGIALDLANNRAYIANSSDTSVSVIDLTLFQEIERISLHEDDTGLDEVDFPFGVAVGTFNGVPFVFTANFDSNNIAVINGNTLEVVGVFP